MARRKKSELQKAKEKAWKWFSLFVRLRDCYRTTGGITHGKCCTCGNLYPIEKLQAGHFVPGRTNALLFREKGCHCQCQRCNLFRHGSIHEYWDFMLDQYGQATIDDERLQRRVTIKYTLDDFNRIAEMYRKRCDVLQADLSD